MGDYNPHTVDIQDSIAKWSEEMKTMDKEFTEVKEVTLKNDSYN